MKNSQTCFTPNLLRLAIAASLLTPTGALANPALQPASGPAGTPPEVVALFRQ